MTAVMRPVQARHAARPWAYRWQRFARSAFVADLRRGTDRALKVLGGFGIVFAALMVLRGADYAALALGLAH